MSTDPTMEPFYLDLQPLDPCPTCKMGMWQTGSVFVRVERDLWLGKSKCFLCQGSYRWDIDPDKPIEHQKINLLKFLA